LECQIDPPIGRLLLATIMKGCRIQLVVHNAETMSVITARAKEMDVVGSPGFSYELAVGYVV
jgi:hypothetical protein